MLLLLRPGLPPFADEQRLAYVAGHSVAWTSGWLTWSVAAISLLAFYVAIAMRLRGVVSFTAVAVATAGAAVDVTTHARLIAFGRFDRELEVLTGFAANGLYTVALVMLVVAGRHVLPRAAIALAVPVALAGLVLAIAAIRNEPRLEIASSAVLFPLFVLWTIVIGRWLRSGE